MESWLKELRYAVRTLGKTPGFTLVALLTLALGIGANTAIFSVVHTVLLRQLPFREPDQLYWVWTRHTSTDRYPFQLPEFCDYRDQSRTLAAVSGFASWSASLTGEGDAERLLGLRVTGNFFDMLGVRAEHGRTILAADDAPGDEKVVVLSHGSWQRRFGSDPAIVGRSLTLNGEAFKVVGVLPADFFFPVRDIELAIPLAPDSDPWRHNRETTNFVRMLARAKPGFARGRIEEDLNVIAKRLREQFPRQYARKLGMQAVPYQEELTRNYRQALWMLLGAVGMVLLIACANLANLTLLRGEQRRKEIAIRQALGVTSARLVRELLTECTLLALAGGGVGMVLAFWGVPALVALSPAAMPRANEIGINAPVLLFTLALSTAAGLLFGLAPALRAGRTDLNEELRTDNRGAGSGADRSRMRRWIAAFEVAAMMVLLTGAGLLLRSFRELQRVDPGFDGAALTVRLSLPRKDYRDLQAMSLFYRELERRIGVLPGVAVVGAANQIPLNGALASADYKPEDRPEAAEDALPTAQYRMVTPGYFRAMNIRLLAGREFSDQDTPERPEVAIISASIARESFSDRSPIGKRLLVEDTSEGFRPLEIVGVAGDVRHSSLEDSPQHHLYVPYHQVHRDLMVWVTGNQYLVVRAAGDPLALVEPVRRELRAVDANVAAADIRTTGEYLRAATVSRRFNLLLVGIFAGLALIMAVVGLYGVVSYSVSQRTREIGLRVALGAGVRDVRALVLNEGFKLTFAGLAAGLLSAIVVSRLVRGLLFGVRPADPLVLAGSVSVLAIVSLLACWVPARRAARVNPLESLRHR